MTSSDNFIDLPAVVIIISVCIVSCYYSNLVVSPVRPEYHVQIIITVYGNERRATCLFTSKRHQNLIDYSVGYQFGIACRS